MNKLQTGDWAFLAKNGYELKKTETAKKYWIVLTPEGKPFTGPWESLLIAIRVGAAKIRRREGKKILHAKENHQTHPLS